MVGTRKPPSFALVGISLTLLLALTPISVKAAEEGDEKCGPDKYILKFSSDKWRETSRKCFRPNDSYTDRSRSGDTDEGDEKCGPDGYILKFRSEKWRETSRKCR